MKLIGYEFVDNLKAFNPATRSGAMYNYEVFEDGVYLSAAREELEVSFPIGPCLVRGLAQSSGPLFDFKLPRVPVELVGELFYQAEEFGQFGLETLFYLSWSQLLPWTKGWQLLQPEQERAAISCRPLEGQASSQRAIVEIHSHHRMAAKFSQVDDADEQGFRIYGVVGRLDKQPEIRIRIGVYGYFWEVPAHWVLELPDGVKDCVEEE